MKIKFDGITLGGGTPFFLSDAKGLRMETNHVTVKTPRSDTTRSIAQWGKPRYRTFSGDLIGTDIDNANELATEMFDRLGRTYDFELELDYLNNVGVAQLFNKYSFRGEVTDVEVRAINSNHHTYTIEVFSEDPLLYLLPELSFSIDIRPEGFDFDFSFPFIFAGTTSTLIVNNTGTRRIYPTLTITGPGSNFAVISTTSDAQNDTFTWNGTLAEGEVLLITPAKVNTIKASINGVSEVGSTNGNFELFNLLSGSNEFTFKVEGGAGLTTQAEFTFQPAYTGIPDIR